MSSQPLLSFDEAEWSDSIRRRELRRNAIGLNKLAGNIALTEDYINSAPRKLAKIIGEIAALMAETLEKTTPSSDLKPVGKFLTIIASHLRYVERARIAQTPWSLVQPAEVLLKSVLKSLVGEDCHFIIRPTWSYNYSIILDFWSQYRRFLGTYDWFPLDSLKAKLTEYDCTDSTKIYCVSFPRLERTNSLLHVSWGHEVGHVLAAKWLEDVFVVKWAQAEPEIKNQIEEYVTRNPPPVDPLFKNAAVKQLTAQFTKSTMKAAEQGFVELLCDHIGLHLFGPSALASMMVFAARFALDVSPLESENYPPWRYRIRKMVDYCEDDLKEHSEIGFPPRTLQPFLEWLSNAISLVKNNRDVDNIKSRIVTKLAYEFIGQHWDESAKQVIDMLPEKLSVSYRCHQRFAFVQKLIERLEDGIPPNEVDGQPVCLQDIICAAWAFKMKKLHEDPAWETYTNIENLFRLVLKGAESNYVHQVWGERIRTADL